MIKVSDIVEQLLLEDGFVIEAMQRGILNTSAYAKEIHKTVEEKTMKPVQLGTIVVALTRIAKTIKKQDFNPKVVIDSFSVTSSLCEFTYEKTEHTTEKLATISSSLINNGEFFTVTEGLHEITIICSQEAKDTIIKHFGIEPKVVINELVGLSVRFSKDYIDVPNTIYSLVEALATRNINVMEIVSTYTELTFIVYRNEMENGIQALNKYSQK